jgi:hypothetical protein
MVLFDAVMPALGSAARKDMVLKLHLTPIFYLAASRLKPTFFFTWPPNPAWLTGRPFH